MGNAVTWSSTHSRTTYLSTDTGYKKKYETKLRIEAPNDLLESRQTDTDRDNRNSRETGRKRSGGIPNVLS